MMQNILKITLALLFFSACSSKPKDVSNEARGRAPVKTQASMTAKQLAAEQEAHYVTEITFEKGSSQLTSTSRQKIERLLSSVKDHDKIDEIKVISWADEAYPPKNVEKLPEKQLKIAEARNQEIKSFLKVKDKTLPIEVHNMAERPSTLSSIWGGPDARIKKSLESAGLTKEGMQAKASHAIVMVELK